MDLVSAFVSQNNRSGLGIGVLIERKVNSENGMEMSSEVGVQFSVGLMSLNVMNSEVLKALCSRLAFQGCLYSDQHHKRDSVSLMSNGQPCILPLKLIEVSNLMVSLLRCNALHMQTLSDHLCLDL